MGRSIRVAVDIGGTFTDLEWVDEGAGRSGTFKSATTPHDPSIGLMRAIAGAAERFGFAVADVTRLMHGTTIATNAVLTRNLPAAALVTTEGFEDVLAIGRHARKEVYTLAPDVPAPLVPRHLRIGAKERVGPRGDVLLPLDEAEVERVAGAVAASGAAVAAVCLLNAFVDPRHEVAIRERIRAVAPHIDVSCSHEISPEIREYERTSTTVLNALLMPVVRGYLSCLEARRDEEGFAAPVYLVQSNGGAATIAAAGDAPARLLLSGPSGGALAAERLAGELGLADVVAVDMGGTSYDVSLIQGGRRAIVTHGDVDGFPVRLPMVEMRTIGAGGGSIVAVDAGGRLQVGPRSAGARPGPVCYGHGGTEPTVTDVNVVLGRLSPEMFENSGIAIDGPAARDALEQHAASKLGMGIEALAEGVLAIVVAKFASAIKLSLFERGLDPSRFALMSFGGAGGLHAIETAAELGIATVAFPANPSTFSAHGILQSDIVHDLAASRIVPLDAAHQGDIAGIAADLARAAREALEKDGIAEADRTVELSADLRYAGQAFELPVPLAPGAFDDDALADLLRRFHRVHHERFSFSDEGEPVQLVTMRASAIGRLAGKSPGADTAERRPQRPRGRAVYAGGGWRETPVHDQAAVDAAGVAGPAIVEQAYTTLYVPEGWRLAAAASGDLVATKEGAR